MSLAFFAHVFRVPTNRMNETLNLIHDCTKRKEKYSSFYESNTIFSRGKYLGWERHIISHLLIFEKRRDPVLQRATSGVFRNETAFRNACSGDRPSRDPTWTVCFRCYYFHRSSILGSFRFLSETIAQCTVHRSIVVSLSNNMLVAETRDATRVTQQCTS